MTGNKGTAERRHPWIAVAFLLAAFTTPAGAAGQAVELGLGAGIAVPLYETANVRTPGLHALAYAAYPLSARLAVRGDLSLTRLPRDGSAPGGDTGDLRIAALAGSLVFTPRSSGAGLYGFAGVGGYAIEGDDGTSDGPVAGLNLGVGTTFGVGPLRAFAQTGITIPFSTFGTDTDSAPLMYLPFAVGLRIPCCGP